MMETVYYYWWWYSKAAMQAWDNLGPRQYATILICVGVMGWLAMRSNMKRC